jgi:cytochrome c oxidase cbb3-type subunit 1
VGYTLPYLFARSLAGILIGCGHVAFAVLLVANLMGWGRQRTGGPTYFVEQRAVPEAVAS